MAKRKPKSTKTRWKIARPLPKAVKFKSGEDTVTITVPKVFRETTKSGQKKFFFQTTLVDGTHIQFLALRCTNRQLSQHEKGMRELRRELKKMDAATLAEWHAFRAEQAEFAKKLKASQNA